MAGEVGGRARRESNRLIRHSRKGIAAMRNRAVREETEAKSEAPGAILQGLHPHASATHSLGCQSGTSRKTEA